MKLSFKLTSVVAAVLCTLQLFSFSSAAIPITDRISQSTLEYRNKIAEQNAKKASERATAQALIEYGKSSDRTGSFASYLARKQLTKQELNAFLWSFIFSQYAIPFEDNLLTVFNQDYFVEMQSELTEVSSVAETLSDSSFNFTSMKASLLEGVVLEDLLDVYTSNMAYIPIVDDSDTSVTLNNLISLSNEGKIYYITDNRITSVNGETSFNKLNKYLFDASSIGTLGISDDFDCTYEQSKIPILAVDNIAYLALQTALGSYCTSQGVTASNFLSCYGNSPLFTDSYGNICIYDGLRYVIAIPNFFNSILANEAVTGEEWGAEERLYMYNKWCMTCYSRQTRGVNNIYPTRLTVTTSSSGGDTLFIDPDTKDWVYSPETIDNSSYLTTYLKPANDADDLRNRMLFMDPNDVYITGLLDTGGLEKTTTFLEDAADVVKAIVCPAALLFKENSVTRNYSLAGEEIDVSDIIEEQSSPGFQGNLSALASLKNVSYIYSNQTGASNNLEGVILPSTFKTANKEIVFGFSSAASSTNPDIYKNPYPFICSHVGVENGVQRLETIFGSFCKLFDTISARTYKLSDNTVKTVNYESANLKDNYTPPYGVFNNSLAVVLGWDIDKVLPQPNVLTINTTSEMQPNTVMFIRDSIVDYGQNMDIYLSSEKGMLLPSFQTFFTGTQGNMAVYLNIALKEAIAWKCEKLDYDDGTTTESTDGKSTTTVYNGTAKITGTIIDENSVLYNSSRSFTLEFTKTTTTYTDPKKEDQDTYSHPYLAGLSDDFASVIDQVYKDRLRGYEYPPGTSGSGSVDFDTYRTTLQSTLGLQQDEIDDFMCFLISAGYCNIIDGSGDNLSNYYFSSNYYLLSRNTNIEPTMGSSNSTDFAYISYFWDRYYLGKLLFRNTVIDNLYDSYNDEPYIEPNAVREHDGVALTFEDYSVLAASKYNSDAEIYYSWLAADDVVVYPFYKAKLSTTLRLYFTPYEDVYNAALQSGNEIGKDNRLASSVITIRPLRTLLALQKNTDYEHNNLAAPVYETGSLERTVTVAMVTTSLWDFISNPVTCIGYILTGMLQSIHSIFGIGDMSYIFDLNWLTTNDAYKFFLSNQFAIILVVDVFLLFVYILTYVFRRKRLKDGIAGYAIKATALSLVPFILLNFFIVSFDATSRWTLADSAPRIMLSQMNAKSAERVNNDAAVQAEITTFKQQFDSISGSYAGLSVHRLKSYDFAMDEPEYEDVAISTLVENTMFNMNDEMWYNNSGFVPVHKSRYSDFVYYYFYDYLKASYLYYFTHKDTTGQISLVLNTFNSDLQPSKSDDTEEARAAAKQIQDADQAAAMLQGNFRTMLSDYDYMYRKTTLDLAGSETTNTYLIDFIGLSNLFYPSSHELLDYQETIQESPWMECMRNSELLRYEDDLTGNSSYLDSDYVRVSGTMRTGSYMNVSTEFNDFELRMQKVLSDTYSQAVSLLSSSSQQIYDEAAISATAMLATISLCTAFGLEPTMPNTNSFNTDTVLKTVYISDLNALGAGTNLLYEMIDENYSVLFIGLVVFLEVMFFLATFIRYALIIVLILMYIASLISQAILHSDISLKLLTGLAVNSGWILLSHALTGVTVSVLTLCSLISIRLVLIAATVLCVMLYVAVMFLLFRTIVLSVLRDPMHLGGVLYEEKISATIAGIHGAIGKLISKINKTHVDSDDTGVEADEATIGIDDATVTTDSSHGASLQDEELAAQSVVNTTAIQQLEQEETTDSVVLNAVAVVLNAVAVVSPSMQGENLAGTDISKPVKEQNNLLDSKDVVVSDAVVSDAKVSDADDIKPITANDLADSEVPDVVVSDAVVSDAEVINAE